MAFSKKINRVKSITNFKIESLPLTPPPVFTKNYSDHNLAQANWAILQ